LGLKIFTPFGLPKTSPTKKSSSESLSPSLSATSMVKLTSSFLETSLTFKPYRICLQSKIIEAHLCHCHRGWEAFAGRTRLMEENETCAWGEGHGVGGQDSKKRMVAVVLNYRQKAVQFMAVAFFSNSSTMTPPRSSTSRTKAGSNSVLLWKRGGRTNP